MSKIFDDSGLANRLAYSREEAAQLLGVSVRHLISEIKCGKLHESISGKRMRRISRKELDRYLAIEVQSEQSHNDLKAAS